VYLEGQGPLGARSNTGKIKKPAVKERNGSKGQDLEDNDTFYHHSYAQDCNELFLWPTVRKRPRVSVVVKALCYKPEGRVFETR
jgi:hypothetical protein